MSKPPEQKLQNIHPGEILREEFLIPHSISQGRPQGQTRFNFQS